MFENYGTEFGSNFEWPPFDPTVALSVPGCYEETPKGVVAGRGPNPAVVTVEETLGPNTWRVDRYAKLQV